MPQMKNFRFNGGEVVRLVQDHPGDGLEAGDCGLVWGVYDMEPTLYEASFFDRNGNSSDMMFVEGDVEEARSSESPFAEKIEELRRLLDDFEAKLRSDEAYGRQTTLEPATSTQRKGR